MSLTKNTTDVITAAIAASKGTADASFNAYTPPKDDDSSDSSPKPLTTQQKTNQALFSAAKGKISGAAKTSGEGAEERKEKRQERKDTKRVGRDPDTPEARAAQARLDAIAKERNKSKKQPTLTAAQQAELKAHQKSAGLDQVATDFNSLFGAYDA
tara:strand:+ start:186 stop:653 length:468 start_codon:yes stop_codon:yes gene_type:complete